VDDGPGKAAGLQQGDIIVERDGDPVDDVTQFRNAIALTAPGTRVELKVWREGSERELEVELGELSEDEATGPGGRATAGTVGLTLSDVTPELRRRERGAVVVRVQPGSLAADVGIRPGDVIERVGRTKVERAADARKLLADADTKKGVRLRVRRGEYGHFVVLRAKK
jgi:serine protease Do